MTKTKSNKKPIKIIIEKTSTGYSAYAEDEDLVFGTTGKTIDELKTNIVEAGNLWFEDEKRTVTIENFIFRYDLQQFFEYYAVLNAAALADKIGMNRALLHQYTSGAKTPSAKQIERIFKGVRELGKELSALELK